MRIPFAAFWLALALLVGQQAAALHDLSHATEQLSQKGGKPGSQACDKCFACAELSGAVGVTVPALRVPACRDEPAAVRFPRAADSPTFLAFRSQAPPSFS